MQFSEEKILESLCRNAHRLYLCLALQLHFFPNPEIDTSIEHVTEIKDALNRRLNEVKDGNNRRSST